MINLYLTDKDIRYRNGLGKFNFNTARAEFILYRKNRNLDILQMYIDGYKQREIADKYHITPQAISWIITRNK